MARTPDPSLHIDEPVVAGLKRVFHALADKGVHVVQHPGESRSSDIHEVRTTIKKMRALLRLVRPVIAEGVFKRNNALLRNAARRL